MGEEGLQLSERLLLTMHNLCATNPDMAKKSDELAQFLQTDANEIERMLCRHESEGYAKSFTDHEGKRRYYLTGVGIIKVCSLFS